MLTCPGFLHASCLILTLGYVACFASGVRGVHFYVNCQLTCRYLPLKGYKFTGSWFTPTAALAELSAYKRARALRLSSLFGPSLLQLSTL